MPVTRIVSLVPSTTESVCWLGARAALVGCTNYCSEPGDLAAVARIGGTKNPSVEAILRLTPDLVLGNAEENRPEDLEFLEARVPVRIQTPRTVPEAMAAVLELAELLQATDRLRPWQQRLSALLATAAPNPPLRCYYAIWPRPWMTVSADTYIDDVLRRCGLHNVAEAAAVRYPEMLPEAAVRAGAELVLLASEPWEFDAAQRDALAAARTFGDAELLLCDGRDYCWHGVRMAEGLGRAQAQIASLRQRRRC